MSEPSHKAPALPYTFQSDMLRGRIDISRDIEGEVVVLACIDLGEDEIRASAHAVSVTISERFRVQAISGDDVLKLRELTALADELSEPGPERAARTFVFSPARLNLYRDAIADYLDSRSEAEWIREDDREPLARLGELLPALGALSEEALRAALSPVSHGR
jgi:predicted Zn-dependent protease with MMP-like domain